MSNPQYRCSFYGLLTLLKDTQLRDEHVEEIKKTPFAHLLMAMSRQELPLGRKHDENLDSIIGSFSKANGKFVFGKVECDILRSDVQLIFGIVDGTEKIDETRRGRDCCEWVQRRLRVPAEEKLTSKKVQSEFLSAASRDDQTSVKDTVRLLCLLLLGTVLLCNTKNKIPWTYAWLVQDIEGMKKYDWCRLIMEKLRDSLLTNRKGPKATVGSTLLLLYWVAEHDKRIKVATDDGDAVTYFPRCCKWVLKKLHKKITTLELNKMKTKDFIVGPLKRTPGKEAIFNAADVEGAGGRGAEKSSSATETDDAGNSGPRDHDKELESVVAADEGNHDDNEGNDADDEWTQTVSAFRREVRTKKREDRFELRRLEAEIEELRTKNKELKAELERNGPQRTEEQEVHEGEQKKDVDGDSVVGTWVSYKSLVEENTNLRDKVASLTVQLFDAEAEINKLRGLSGLSIYGMEEGDVKADLTTEHGLVDVAIVPVSNEGLPDFWTKDEEEVDVAKREAEVTAVTQSFIKKREKALGRGVAGKKAGGIGSSSLTRRVTDRKAKKQKTAEQVPKTKGRKGKKKKTAEQVPATQPQEMKRTPAVLKANKDDYGIGMHIHDAVYEQMMTIFLSQGPTGVVWRKADDPRVHVTIEDIVEILEGEYVANWVVDAWGVLLRRKRIARDETYITRSTIWSECMDLQKKNIFDNPHSNVIKEEGEAGRTVLMPMVSTGYGMRPFHWTLLVYRPTNNGEWEFYNSMRPAEGGAEDDTFYKDAVSLRHYLLQSAFPGEMSQEMLGREIRYMWNAPQQTAGRNDCAFFVCYFMHQLCRGLEIKENVEDEWMDIYKGDMINQIVGDYYNSESESLANEEFVENLKAGHL